MEAEKRTRPDDMKLKQEYDTKIKELEDALAQADATQGDVVKKWQKETDKNKALETEAEDLKREVKMNHERIARLEVALTIARHAAIKLAEALLVYERVQL